MPRARALACQALILALAASACADSQVSDGGETGDDGEIGEDLPEQDAQLRCGAAVAPTLAAVGPIAGGVALGPCGHLAYHDDQGGGWLIAPDGERSEFDHDRIRFAPTGDLVAWARDPDEGLTLRHLVSGHQRVVQVDGAVDGFGFVPSFADPDRGAWLWSCEQGLLEKHVSMSSETVAESVDCASVSGSTGSPRLAFGDTEGRVWLADLDGGALVESDDVAFVAHDGSKRDDTLWIDHDGELVVHVAIEWQGDDDVDAEWPVELWARVLDRAGTTVLELSSGVSLRQAPRRGAPAFVFGNGEAVRFDAGSPSSVDAAIESAELAESGELFFTTAADEVLMAESVADEPLTSVGEFGTPVELQPSRSADHLAVEHHSDICILDEQGECNRILLTLRKWSREQGVAGFELLSTTPWNLEATLDDGSSLVVGAPVEAEGPTYMGEEPPPRVLLLDAEGAIRAELPGGNGDLAIRQVFTLAEDRVLFEYQPESGIGELVLSQTDGGFVSLVAGVDVALLESWVDARAERVAFVDEQVAGGTLWYGAI